MSVTLYSWSVMASSIGVLLFIYCLGWKATQFQACGIMVIGMITAVVWKESEYSNSLYAAFPGMVAGFVTFGTLKLSRKSVGSIVFLS